MTDKQRHLDRANLELSEEITLIYRNLAVYQIIGRNWQAIKAIPTVTSFFATIQNQSLETMVLGLSKVFERSDNFQLCSIAGVYQLATQVEMVDKGAAHAFVETYGVHVSAEWTHDVEQVFSRQRPWVKQGLRGIRTLRNTRLAHLQQDAPEVMDLPNIAEVEALLTYASNFHVFITSAFCGVVPRLSLDDPELKSSLLSVLRCVGVPEPVSTFVP